MAAQPPTGLPVSLQAEFNVFAFSKGAVFSLSQTKVAQPHQAPPIFTNIARPRFTTAYYAQYLGNP
jgi:hypothetical protein